MLIHRRVKHASSTTGPQRCRQGRHPVTFGEYGIQALDRRTSRNGRSSRSRIAMDPAHQAWRQGLDQHLPGPADHQEAGRDPDGVRQGLARVWVANVSRAG